MAPGMSVDENDRAFAPWLPVPLGAALLTAMLAVLLAFLFSGLIISRPAPPRLIVAVVACALLLPVFARRRPSRVAFTGHAYVLALAAGLLMSGAGVLAGYVFRVPFGEWDQHPISAGVALMTGVILLAAQRRVLRARKPGQSP